MKRTHKKVLGLFCLGLVAVMTIFAALLPVPETQATASVTDTIQVRVVGSVPNVDILGINSGEIIVSPSQSFTVNYENSHTVTVTLRHKDLDGNIQTYDLDVIDADYYAGSENYNLRFIK